jgi:hypothetical protein
MTPSGVTRRAGARVGSTFDHRVTLDRAVWARPLAFAADAVHQLCRSTATMSEASAHGHGSFSRRTRSAKRGSELSGSSIGPEPNERWRTLLVSFVQPCERPVEVAEPRVGVCDCRLPSHDATAAWLPVRRRRRADYQRRCQDARCDHRSVTSLTWQNRSEGERWLSKAIRVRHGNWAGVGGLRIMDDVGIKIRKLNT